MRGHLFYREAVITAPVKDRRVDLSFSSEIRVKRPFGAEILLHDESAVDLLRLNALGAVLFNHSPDKIIGRPERVWLQDRKGRATIVFDNDATGEMAMKKVQSGSLRGVSVGYAVTQYQEVKAGESWRGFQGPVFVATKWTPYEISLTAVPADATIGVGRSVRDLAGIEIVHRSNGRKEDKIMRLSNSEYQELLSRASVIGPEAVVKFSQMVGQGYNEDAIRRALWDLASPIGGKAASGSRRSPSFTWIDDETFIRALTNPAIMTLD